MLVDDENVQPVVLVLHGIDAEVAIIALRLDHALSAAGEGLE